MDLRSEKNDARIATLMVVIGVILGAIAMMIGYFGDPNMSNYKYAYAAAGGFFTLAINDFSNRKKKKF